MPRFERKGDSEAHEFNNQGDNSMTDEERLEARLTALERATVDLPKSRARLRLFGLGVFLIVSLITANLWLMNANLNRRAQSGLEHLFWILCQQETPAQQRAEALGMLVAQGHTEWRSANLQHLDLDGTQLRGANLHHANFRHSSLVNANLTGANLGDAKFNHADLSKADLTEATLSRADLFKAVLEGARLRQSDLKAALLEQVKARAADLMVANLSEANLIMADLREASLAGADLTDANLEGANLTSANLSLARISGANLSDINLTDSNWWKARGLTSAQVMAFKAKFAPTEAAQDSLRQDYDAWLASSDDHN